MFAVIKTGGKQYRVAAKDVITIAKLDAQPGESVTFGEVLMFTNDNGTELGGPTVQGVTVAGEVVEQTRGPKVIAFKKRRRQNSKRKRRRSRPLLSRPRRKLLPAQKRRPQLPTTPSRRSRGRRARRRPRAANRPP